MRWKAVVRRNWTFFALWLAMAGFFVPLFAVMFFSSYSFFIAVAYTVLIALGSFLNLAFLPGLIYELLRVHAARQWKKGNWLSVSRRREIRFGKRYAQRTVKA